MMSVRVCAQSIYTYLNVSSTWTVTRLRNTTIFGAGTGGLAFAFETGIDCTGVIR